MGGGRRGRGRGGLVRFGEWLIVFLLFYLMGEIVQIFKYKFMGDLNLDLILSFSFSYLFISYSFLICKLGNPAKKKKLKSIRNKAKLLLSQSHYCSYFSSF